MAIWSSQADWDTGTFSNVVVQNNGLVVAPGQTAGTWTSGVVDFGALITSWAVTLNTTGTVGYLTRSGPTGHPTPDSSWTPWTHGLVQPPQEYGQLQLTLSTGASVSSAEWIGISTLETRSGGNVFHRIVQQNFGLGVNLDGDGMPGLTFTAPASVSAVYATVQNERLTLAITSPLGNQGFSYDLSGSLTLEGLVTQLQQNLFGWTITIAPPPQNFSQPSLGPLSAALLEDVTNQNLLTSPTMNIWTSVLWLVLKPAAKQIGQLGANVLSVPDELSVTRAEGAWLDRLGDFLGVARYPTEPDSLYRQRLLLTRFTPPTPLAAEKYLGFSIEIPSPGSVQILYPASYQNAPNFVYSEAQVLDTYGYLVPIGFAVSVNIIASQLSDVFGMTDSLSAATLENSSSTIVYDTAGPPTYDRLGVWQ